MSKIKKFFSGVGKKIRSIKLPKIDLNKKGKSGRPLWMFIVLIIVALYVLSGIVFAVFTYKNCASEGDKKCYRENKAVKFAAKIYPFPASWVNFNPIWMADYNKQMDYIRHFSQKSGQELPDRNVLKDQILDQMTDILIIKKQAAKNKVKVTKADVDEAYKKITDENGGSEEVKKVLKDLYNMTESDFKALIKDQLYKEKVQSELFVQIRAKHILIKDENRAKDVLEKVKKGEKSFEDLAKEFSEDTGSKDNGGDLGFFGRGAMVKEFEEAAFSTEVGKVREELVKSEFGFHIIKVEEKKGSIDKSFTDWFNEIKEKTKIRKWLN